MPSGNGPGALVAERHPFVQLRANEMNRVARRRGADAGIPAPWLGELGADPNRAAIRRANGEGLPRDHGEMAVESNVAGITRRQNKSDRARRAFIGERAVALVLVQRIRSHGLRRNNHSGHWFAPPQALHGDLASFRQLRADRKSF